MLGMTSLKNYEAFAKKNGIFCGVSYDFKDGVPIVVADKDLKVFSVTFSPLNFVAILFYI